MSPKHQWWQLPEKLSRCLTDVSITASLGAFAVTSIQWARCLSRWSARHPRRTEGACVPRVVVLAKPTARPGASYRPRRETTAMSPLNRSHRVDGSFRSQA
jgi:hypothetical protein